MKKMLTATRGIMSNKLSDGLLSVQQAAQELDLSESTVRRLIEIRELQAIRLGRKKIRIDRAELIRYLERQKTR
jgi:excisionase family DNA binding protein